MSSNCFAESSSAAVDAHSSTSRYDPGPTGQLSQPAIRHHRALIESPSIHALVNVRSSPRPAGRATSVGGGNVIFALLGQASTTTAATERYDSQNHSAPHEYAPAPTEPFHPDRRRGE